jgi:adenylate kinase family enzyme
MIDPPSLLVASLGCIRQMYSSMGMVERANLYLHFVVCINRISGRCSCQITMNTTIQPKRHPIIAVRRAGVPLVAFETSDPAQSIVEAVKALNGKADTTPVLRWDIVRGLVGLNRPGSAVASQVAPDGPIQSGNPAECLSLLERCQAENLICFFMNAHRFIGNEAVAQGLWNLRDAWKAKGNTLVLLCPSMRLPDDLAHDIVVVSEPLPSPTEVGAIVDSIAKDAGAEVTEKAKVVDTLLGVSAFAAEQALAMSLGKNGDGKITINRDELWERKRKMVEQTPGLSVWRGQESFADVGGLANIKDFLTKILASGKNPVRAIMYIDEIEKLFAGTAGDTSGVSQDQLRVFLTTMQDDNLPGIILIGPPGTGKSAIAKAAGSIADAEVISTDTGAMTGSLVGESQAKIRKAMATFRAVSQGKGLVIATCNSISSLPPELRRRFSLGTFFVDLPSTEERASIWSLWLKKYSLAADAVRPNDVGWTGAEIRACCDVAYRAGVSLVEASSFIVPVSKSAADKIDALRKSASGKFISANHSGTYIYDPNAEASSTGRKFDTN